MSGLAGVLNLDGRPVGPEILEAFASGLAQPDGDQHGQWSEGPIGFVSRLLRITPESRHDPQPAVDRLGNVLVFDGRLDNRHELLQSLPVGAGKQVGDAALILEAWRRWGSDCLRRLDGEFALALFDAGERTLILARDPVGCRPLYYRDDGQRLVFGSRIKAVAAHPGIRVEPNENLLADFFVLEQLPYDDTGETFFAGIFAVLPGWMLRVSAAGRRSAQFRDFDPTAQIRYRSQTDYAERLRELLTQAVRRRLRSDYPVAIAASGGLDSSVVLCLADEIRKRERGNAPLLPTTCVLATSTSIDGNRPTGLDRLEAARGLVIDRVPAAAAGDLRDVEAAAWQSEWPRFDDGWCALRPMFQRAYASGARVMLSGHWSDQLLFVTGYLSDLFMMGSWRQVARHLDEYSRWYPDADPRYFRQRFRRELLLDVVPETVRARIRPIWRRLMRPGGHPLVESRLVRRVARRRARLFRPHCASAHARNIYQSVRHMSHRLQFEADHKLAASCGIEITTPFLDRDVIQYLMSIPGDVQNRGGVPRALLREAMRGIVPDEILGRRWYDEGTAAARQRAYLGTTTKLTASNALGLVREASTIDQESLDLLGLEFWSRAFFSDTLTSPQHSQRSPHSLQGAVNLWTTQPRRIRMAKKNSPTRLRS